MLTKLRDTNGRPLWVDLATVTAMHSRGEMLTLVTSNQPVTFRACYADEMETFMSDLSKDIERARNTPQKP